MKDKIEALSTISRVFVTRNEYPTAFTGGWGANAVVDATQGPEWKVTFLRIWVHTMAHITKAFYSHLVLGLFHLNTYDGTLTGTVKQETVVRLVKVLMPPQKILLYRMKVKQHQRTLRC